MGGALAWNWMVVCSNLVKHELSFLIAKNSFGMNVKEQRIGTLIHH